jgi:hypothetical protein
MNRVKTSYFLNMKLFISFVYYINGQKKQFRAPET